jgi:hypothetical protein
MNVKPTSVSISGLDRPSEVRSAAYGYKLLFGVEPEIFTAGPLVEGENVMATTPSQAMPVLQSGNKYIVVRAVRAGAAEATTVSTEITSETVFYLRPPKAGAVNTVAPETPTSDAE